MGPQKTIPDYQKVVSIDNIDLPLNFGRDVKWKDYYKYVDQEAIFLCEVFYKASSKVVSLDVSDNYILSECLILLENAIKRRQHNHDAREALRNKNGNNKSKY